jgi:hypothetical protein
MIPLPLDIVFRFGRLLGTVRSLVIQTEQLIDVLGNLTSLDVELVDGLDL